MGDHIVYSDETVTRYPVNQSGCGSTVSVRLEWRSLANQHTANIPTEHDALIEESIGVAGMQAQVVTQTPVVIPVDLSTEVGTRRA